MTNEQYETQSCYAHENGIDPDPNSDFYIQPPRAPEPAAKVKACASLDEQDFTLQQNLRSRFGEHRF
jgi:hypothetical protein